MHAFGISLSEFFSEEQDAADQTSKQAELLSLFNSVSEEAQQSILCLLREINKG